MLSLQFGVDSKPFCTQELQDRPAAYRCAGDAFANACAVLAGGGFGAQAMVISRMLWLTQALSGPQQHQHLAGLGTGRGRHGGSQISRLWKTPRTSMKERMSSMAFCGWKSCNHEIKSLVLWQCCTHLQAARLCCRDSEGPVPVGCQHSTNTSPTLASKGTHWELAGEFSGAHWGELLLPS